MSGMNPISWSLTALLLGAGCGPGVGDVVSSGSDTAEASSGSSSNGVSASDGLDSSGSPQTWPEDSYGAFYLAYDFPLGIPGAYLASLSNLELSPDGLVVTHLSCRGAAFDEEERFEVTYEGTEAHVRPREGDAMVMWRGGPLAAELIFRPGASCTALSAEIVDPDPSTGGYGTEMQWTRGALVVTDPCDEPPIQQFEWAADLDPDVPTDCPGG